MPLELAQIVLTRWYDLMLVQEIADTRQVAFLPRLFGETQVREIQVAPGQGTLGVGFAALPVGFSQGGLQAASVEQADTSRRQRHGRQDTHHEQGRDRRPSSDRAAALL